MATKTRAKAPAKKAPARKTAGKPRPRAAKQRAAAEPAPAAALGGGPRRAVFIDVENTSSESELVRVLDDLAIDLTSGNTEVAAIGNWRVVGQQLGRSLAQRGAHLVHSAPATRVPDWSDLWIAVHAGMWLGRSRPGDRIEIVSHDRAFDAVGDAAARLGVGFTRITYRPAHQGAAAHDRAAEPTGERRRRRRRRGGSGRAPAAAAPQAPSGRAAHAPPRESEEPHAAPHDQLQQVIARLAAADPARTVTLDALTVALKAAGFQRPPGSPRLMTRLRRMKDIEVLPNGRVRLLGEVETARVASPIEPLVEPTAGAESSAEASGDENGAASKGTGRRSRRRGGRRRGGRGRKGAAAAPAPASE